MVSAGGRNGGDVDGAAMPDGPVSCTGCRGGALTRLPMVLTDGTEVVFVSCHSCERREWFQPAVHGWEQIPIDSVLRRSTKYR
ncbi:hypothetical protein [Actinotalea sp. Marseille-Q4924]|uniref:hypothetical protein n=1 Tax=Actinotalea sp. Marseille-Q4924 TaxID=2866571 RepID=UPI001CE40706|nr:hypothetical protein [Actinotalea sp. Marseille-Q4924]